MASVEINRTAKAAVMKLLGGSEALYNKVLYRSLKSAVKESKKDQAYMASKHYSLTNKYVKDKIKTLGPYSFTNLKARTSITHEPPSLTSFSGTRQVNAGVKVKVLRAGAAKIIPRAFIRESKGDKKQVFWRVRDGIPDAQIWPSKKRYTGFVPEKIAYPQRGRGASLEARKGPRITDYLDNPAVTKELLILSDTHLQMEISKQINKVLKGF